jgi:hypothetical protein
VLGPVCLDQDQPLTKIERVNPISPRSEPEVWKEVQDRILGPLVAQY